MTKYTEFWIIIILIEFVLIGIPVTTFFITKSLFKREINIKIILISSFVIIFFGLFSFLTDISFINSNIDIIAGIIIFTSLCLIIWIIPNLLKSKILKVLTKVILLIPIVLSILSATVGILGLFFVVKNLKPDKEMVINKYYFYKEYNLGAAFTGDHLRIILTKDIFNFGILEKEIARKDYHSPIVCRNDIKVRFELDNLYIDVFEEDSLVFQDTIPVNN